MAKRKGAYHKQPIDQTLTPAGELVAGVKGHKPHSKAIPTNGVPNEIHMDWYRQWTRMGLSTHEIARRAGCSQPSVHEAVHKVRKYIWNDAKDDADAFRDLLTEHALFVIQESMAAWEKSKELSVVKTTESGVSAGEHGGEWSKDATREEAQCGNASYLAQIRGAGDDIREMWGIDAPAKHEMSGNGLIPIPAEAQTRKQMVRSQLLASLVALETDDGSSESA